MSEPRDRPEPPEEPPGQPPQPPEEPPGQPPEELPEPPPELPERPPDTRSGAQQSTDAWVGRFLHNMWSANPFTVTGLAIVLALLVGAVLIIVSDESVRATYAYFFARPQDALSASWDRVSDAYATMFRGAIVDPGAVERALSGTGKWATVLRPISETLVSATPLVFTGLAFSLAFRAGLFNIGVQGQAILGAIGAGLAGFLLPLPIVVHVVVTVLAGALFGGAWGFVPGILKARTGAHEVIVTIMLNSVAALLIGWVIVQEFAHNPDRQDPISKPVDESGRLPRLFGWWDSELRVHAGILLAVLAVAGVSMLLSRLTFGFELRAVGLNPNAARTAGMSVSATYILVMTAAGALAGLGGASMVLGTAYAVTALVVGSVGFDGILVGLLGRARPVGVLGAALLFGALSAGGRAAQTGAGVSLELVQVLQALIVIFVAAPALVKAAFGLRAVRLRGIAGTAARGW